MFPKFQNYFEEDEFYYTIRKEAFITFKNLPLKGEREKNTLRKKKTPSRLHNARTQVEKGRRKASTCH